MTLKVKIPTDVTPKQKEILKSFYGGGTSGEKKEGFFDKLIGVSEDKLDSHSPSRVYEKLGKTIPQGVAAGIDGDAQKAVDAPKRMTAAVEAVYQASSQKTKKSIEEQMKDLVELGEKYDEEVENLWTELGESIAAVQDKYDQELESRTQSIMSSLGVLDGAQ